MLTGMPYIITTRRLLPQPTVELVPAGTLLGSAGDGRVLVVSRRAVATLEEAKRAAYKPIDDQRADFKMGPRVYGRLRRIAFDWSGSGGTVGPLPDGTVIEVEPIEWKGLARAAGLLVSDHLGTDAILDAYNAS